MHETEYDGDRVVILPKGYLNSVDAAVDLYADDIAAVAANLEVASLRQSGSRRILRSSMLGALLWMLPGAWSICI